MSRNATGKRVRLLVWEVAGASILSAILLALLLAGPLKVVEAAPKLPSGFQEEVVFSGLREPMNVEFSRDGRVFVAEKSGVIKVFDNLSDTTPTTFADLRTNVHNFWDRGLLGLALDPDFPTSPYVYALYTHDALIGGAAPRWGTAGATSDACPNPPGATVDGCVVSGRLSRLTASGNSMSGAEQVLIEDWCQQYYTHSVGTLAFGSDGALYVSGGEGAKATSDVDYGQGGGSPGSPTPKNPCGDPPSGIGGTQKPPKAEGGALRSQDLRTGGDPVTLDGAILRVNPKTGAALPTNPLFSRADLKARRIVAYGLRNPFRFALRPGTREVWVGDVGWRSREEINRIANPTATKVRNFGWPCYEGSTRQAGYNGANLNICENLYKAANAVSDPYYAYPHGKKVVAGEACAAGNSSVSGLAFYTRGPYPDRYDGALFFADYSRNCIWAMRGSAKTNGLPDPTKVATFVAGAANPVELQIGPGGDLFYVDMGSPGAADGTIRRISYPSGNRPPIARATASPTSGQIPLTVNFDGTGSDANGDALSYEWDLDGDGEYDDSTSAKPTYTYTASRDYEVSLRVSNSRGASDTLDQPIRISAGNTAPEVSIDSPASTATWRVGQKISFSGSATDKEDGALASSRLSWSLILQHCSPGGSSCHAHPVQDFSGVSSGAFAAPDHEYPSYLQLRLTATDSRGLTTAKTVRLNPKTVRLRFTSKPRGLRLVVGATRARAPFARTVIVGSNNSISAPSPQKLRGKRYRFASWSDKKARTHSIVAPNTAKTYTARFKR